ncbi:MAG: hypothetical protein ABL903_14125 [Methylococcales bacterium]
MTLKRRLANLEARCHKAMVENAPIIIDDYANTDTTAFFMIALATGREVIAGSDVFDGAALRLKHWGYL